MYHLLSYTCIELCYTCRTILKPLPAAFRKASFSIFTVSVMI